MLSSSQRYYAAADPFWKSQPPVNIQERLMRKDEHCRVKEGAFTKTKLRYLVTSCVEYKQTHYNIVYKYKMQVILYKLLSNCQEKVRDAKVKKSPIFMTQWKLGNFQSHNQRKSFKWNTERFHKAEIQCKSAPSLNNVLLQVRPQAIFPSFVKPKLPLSMLEISDSRQASE